jgi:hypothetical protein
MAADEHHLEDIVQKMHDTCKDHSLADGKEYGHDREQNQIETKSRKKREYGGAECGKANENNHLISM